MLPAAFRKAIEETVRHALRDGLSGWPVTDCTVTLTHSGYTPPPPSGWSRWSTSAADFRGLTPLVLMTALQRADTRVHEPVHSQVPVRPRSDHNPLNRKEYLLLVKRRAAGQRVSYAS